MPTVIPTIPPKTNPAHPKYMPVRYTGRKVHFAIKAETSHKVTNINQY
jgi:hypothetical protein